MLLGIVAFTHDLNITRTYYNRNNKYWPYTKILWCVPGTVYDFLDTTNCIYFLEYLKQHYIYAKLFGKVCIFHASKNTKNAKHFILYTTTRATILFLLLLGVLLLSISKYPFLQLLLLVFIELF